MLMAKIFKPIRWPQAAFQSGASRDSRVGTQPVTNTSPSGQSAATGDAFAGTYVETPGGSSADVVPSTVPDIVPGIVPGSWDAAKEPPPSAEEDAWLTLLDRVFDETGWPDADPSEAGTELLRRICGVRYRAR